MAKFNFSRLFAAICCITLLICSPLAVYADDRQPSSVISSTDN